MKKIFCFLFLLILSNLAAIGQQDPQFGFSKFAHLTVNPGYAGSNDAISGLILNRYQWSGIEGAPKTLVFSVETAAKLFGSNSGVGFNIISDELGLEKNVLINLNYAYHVTTGIGELGMGLSFGIFNKSYSAGWEFPTTTQGGTGLYDNNDPLLAEADVSQVAFDAGFGLYLRSKEYFAGFSVTHLNQSLIEFSDLATTYLRRHYYLYGGYNIILPDPLFQLQPSIIVKSDMASTQYDFNLDVVYDDRFWGGLTYRPQDAISVLLGVELINGLKVGFGYDVTTSALGRYSFGSQEIFLQYSMNLGKSGQKKYKSIRFL
ncbi:PorP/SprF family type IX secretion system membrane protein [Sunxiuqinia sp. A32]|uniref:PorP/SprF family type IX secretion system membrane protein n=1 Tax=Sunxiuqinia sp. A32 TaxID=3461496 RepID=UPI0040467AC9